jgi:tripartite-type tricarboxylate transporter receptor subunit TctC
VAPTIAVASPGTWWIIKAEKNFPALISVSHGFATIHIPSLGGVGPITNWHSGYYSRVPSLIDQRNTRMIQSRRSILQAATAFLGSLAVAPARALTDYPSKPIKIIVAAAPGSPSDIPARIASQMLTSRLGQAVVVENRPGAGGALGARVAAASPPDGYTLLIGNSSNLAAIPAVSDTAGYDPVADFSPIVRIMEGYQLVVAGPTSPWKTLKDFVADAKARPGAINYGHTGPGGLPHLAAELFMLRAGVKLTGVSYRGGGESANAIMANSIQATFENISVLRGLVEDGKLRALAVMHKSRSALLPSIPTTAEEGIAQCEANTFFGLVAPRGTPADIVDKLNKAINEELSTSAVRTAVAALGSEVIQNTPAEFAAYIAVQSKRWAEVGKAAGVKIN